MNEDNNLIKTWYFYFKWAGLWKAHRIGIRMGNFEMQHESLSAFAPLFPVADISGLSNMTAEYTSEGWTRLFNCYSIGEERLNVILQQDILKREKRVAKGRRAKNIGHNKIANMKKSNNNNTKGRGRGGVQHFQNSLEFWNCETNNILILVQDQKFK
ncbi:hypothetical protein GLOIN_2v1480143 [Rhizophagus irregularis DAOM 181602=DAOM 197198]|uniref:Uncharacterized protein n=1 Tax=Rhizophagus irregularis (strain DAOM 181602 / DAOM 197198 / MUCL 43194) TaxID=747089 RepID=A0A2P4PVB2_RHIID|nr:hypothetical protein GLOIN_2v1480143 [Rhizophagus irregularis DAOM 181602=DAOM 197198]POG69311.1 hypothetical protein GLOIN_2v1480143 [Rhizophagus irregularis DAOM 181602=DAOM 197198]|eukprot:XP_025176177.1 hypothetical protein GLOIN_2v1480143 [Rhizophagus irregularis DAOM 181602=DAOM 197198]